ncbi:MAG: A24 family peptidase [Rhizomicrobium sp.]|jgi:leader peptidase (prepilin peptidase)/N-methyltransferase
MNVSLQLVVTIAAFALAGGWSSARAAVILSGRRFSVAMASALCVALAAWAAAIMGWTVVFAITLALGWALLTLAAIDILAFRLPDILTFPLAAAGLLVAQVVAHDLWAHVAGAAIGYCAFAAIAWGFERARGREGLGLGDAKLAAAAGAWLGWMPLPSVVLIACAAGFLWVASLAIVRGRAALAERIPFGMALAIAIWVVWLYGPLEFLGGGA